jgi:hypothetical protein
LLHQPSADGDPSAKPPEPGDGDAFLAKIGFTR